jgi:hypothetical protein
VSGYPNGLVWLTGPQVISLDDVETHLGDGTASLQFQNVDVNDWITVKNSLSDGTLLGPAAPATMTLNIEWSNVTRRLSGFSDPTNGFGGDFLENSATIEIAIQNSDGSFSFSGSGDTSSCFAQIGQMQNGSFFSG